MNTSLIGVSAKKIKVLGHICILGKKHTIYKNNLFIHSLFHKYTYFRIYYVLEKTNVSVPPPKLF